MATILIVEDEMNIHQMVKEYIEKRKDTCIDAFSGTEALLQLQYHTIDLVLLDLMLPGICGEEVITKIKDTYADIPIIIMSAKNSIQDKVSLLNKGADDYVCKPFALEELYARIQAQLRKSSTKESSALTYENMELSNDQRTLYIDEQAILLTRHEYKIMELLFSHPRQGFTKKDIYEYAWEDIYAADDKTIHVHISNIRNKCKAYKEDIIETIWGIGFKLRA